MFGPMPAGHWSGRSSAGSMPDLGPLKPGRRFRVTRAFEDFDGCIHPPGEIWTYLGHNFLPCDDGMSLFVSLDGEQERHIRLQWRPDAQGAVLDDLGAFFAPVADLAG